MPSCYLPYILPDGKSEAFDLTTRMHFFIERRGKYGIIDHSNKL